ncbi:hypothetical protein SH668x_003628 [Planctomicrobium sp. SH668]|uniref:hypothetical protein n=1 Tax=Planctomicrobium sp. SH668 TaxID=3448126 RepID=UPI003F5B074A
MSGKSGHSNSNSHSSQVENSHNLSDADWLKTLHFRNGCSSKIATAAKHGDVVAFAKGLPQAFERECRIGKRERARVLGSLLTFWKELASVDQSDLHEGSLAQCLLNTSLTSEELSQAVQAKITESSESGLDQHTLIAAHWLLRLGARHLDDETYFTLFRWTFESTCSWLSLAGESKDQDAAEDEVSCTGFDTLEIQVLHSLICPDLKGNRKLYRSAVQNLRRGLEAIVDNDGTPHARILDEIIPRLTQLAALTLFADCVNASIWNRESHQRLEGLFCRSALLVTPRHVATTTRPVGQVCSTLLAVAEVLHLKSRPGLISLLSKWESASFLSVSNEDTLAIRGKLPLVSQQSDWAEWASLRSSWKGPVDQFLVKFAGEIPEIDVIAANQNLFSGEWSHTLKVNGVEQIPTGSWTCCCWFFDKDAVFIELQMNADSPIQIVRQALLVRNESLLMISDSVRTPEKCTLEFTKRLPLAAGWSHEEDRLSREQALIHGSLRVRVFPWTSPQMRLDRSDETMTIDDKNVTVSIQSHGKSLYLSTLFDWSPKRTEDPVEWYRLTVVENGQYIPPEVAVGHRIRFSKKQWMVYHSHQEAQIPRSVLGVHTNNETVFGRFTPQGNLEPLVEVEL